jgi:hypothetical protein
VFVAVDHGSAECVGIHAARRATRFEDQGPIRQGGGAASVDLLKGSGVGSRCAMIMDHNTRPMPSRRSSRSFLFEASFADLYPA